MRIVLLMALAISCGGKKSGDSAGGDTDKQIGTAPTITSSWTIDELTGACDSTVRVGGFEVAQWPAEGSTDAFAAVTGYVAAGITPSAVYFPRETAGDCTLLQREYPFCDPPCEALEVCTHDEVCEPFPANQDVGTIFVAGLNTDVAMNPDATNWYWDTNVPYPLFDPGDGVLIENAGGTVGEIRLRGLGVTEMAVPPGEWHVVRGDSLEVNWTPGAGHGEVLVAINVDQHGNSPVTLTCATADDGSMSVDGGLIEQLLQYGVSGFATGTVRRRSADKMDVSTGCIDLQVYSQANAPVTVEGHTPCTIDDDCPDGQHCEVAINTCVPD